MSMLAMCIVGPLLSLPCHVFFLHATPNVSEAVASSVLEGADS